MTVPDVSVVMAIYNGERYLAFAIESILAQTYAHFEFIIIDDGSTDSTASILERFARRDDRIRVHRNLANIGLTRSLNLGLELAQGGLIARQDADDVSLPERLEKQVMYMQANPNCVLLGVTPQIIDANGQVQRNPFRERRQPLAAGGIVLRWYLLYYNHIVGHSGVMFRRQVAAQVGGYDPYFRQTQDYDLWVRLAEAGDVVILPDVLLQLRFHTDNISTTKAAAQLDYSFEIVARQLTALLGNPINKEDVAPLSYFGMGAFAQLQHPLSIAVAQLRIVRKFAVQHHLARREIKHIAHHTAKQWRLWDVRTKWKKRHKLAIKLCWLFWRFNARHPLTICINARIGGAHHE